ncbi:DUF4129 domain-containing protein [Halosimplex sp. J119]
MSPRTVALALLCVAVIAFAAATLDSTTNPNPEVGMGYTGVDEDLGGERTPTDEPSGDSEDGRNSPLDLDTDPGTPFQLCQAWLQQPLVQLLLVLGLVGVFAVGRWLDDAATGLAAVFVLGYPGFFVYLLFTSCGAQNRGFLGLSDQGRPASEGGGLMGGASTVAPPSLSTKLLFLLVVGTLVAVAALVLTGNHDQTERETVEADEEDPEPEPATDVGAIGAAAGRAADRIEATDEFENEVYRAWAAMTDHLAVDHPESSTPAEFATAATVAGMDPDDVARLTELFEEVRYGGEAPTAEREETAVETLRRIEETYAAESAGAGGDDADERTDTDAGGIGS